MRPFIGAYSLRCCSQFVCAQPAARKKVPLRQEAGAFSSTNSSLAGYWIACFEVRQSRARRLRGSNRRDTSTADCSEGCENIALQRVKPNELSVVGFACAITTEQEHDERKRISPARASCRRGSRAFGRPRSTGGAAAASAAMLGSCNRSRAVGTPGRKFGAAQAQPADQTSGTVTAPFSLRWLLGLAMSGRRLLAST
jgi:hypothetical protein